jgi:hypothetical protein
MDQNERMEEQRNRSFERKADQYYDKYREHMDQLSGSLLAEVRGGTITAADVYALGCQLEQWENYHAICEEEGNVNLLGKLPDIAMSVITATQGVAIMPVIASVQPIEEEQGTVYFRQVRAADTRGTATAGDKLQDPRQIGKTLSGYASAEVTGETGDTGDGSATSFSFTLAAAPVKAQSLRIRMETGTAEALDIGAAPGGDSNVGRLYGTGVSGTVNYTTGAVALTFAAAPANGNDILCDYQQNMEKSEDLPQLDSFFDSTSVKAKVYALKGTFGLLQSYAMKKRFGKMAEDEMARDLVAEINKEIGGDLIRQLRANAVGSTTFDRTPPDGISAFENRQEIKQKLADAAAVMWGNAGRGDISVLIAGRTMAATLSTLPGFQRIGDANAIGPHVFGTLDGITVVKVNEAAVLGADQGVALWKGPTPWEAACVYAPYMPLAVTGTLQTETNPLQHQKACATWAAVKTVVPNFSTRFDFTAS